VCPRRFSFQLYHTNIRVFSGPPSTPTIKEISGVSENSAIVTWLEGFSGGFVQTIHIQTSIDMSVWTHESALEVNAISENNAYRNTTVRGLEGGKLYHVRLFASNKRGISEMSDVWNFTTTGMT